MRMRDKTAVVTGAGSDIGRATARRLAAEGARVACADLVAVRTESTATAITDADGEALAPEIDVTDAGACARMIEVTQRRFGAVTQRRSGVRHRRGLAGGRRLCRGLMARPSRAMAPRIVP